MQDGESAVPSPARISRATTVSRPAGRGKEEQRGGRTGRWARRAREAVRSSSRSQRRRRWCLLWLSFRALDATGVGQRRRSGCTLPPPAGKAAHLRSVARPHMSSNALPVLHGQPRVSTQRSTKAGLLVLPKEHTCPVPLRSARSPGQTSDPNLAVDRCHRPVCAAATVRGTQGGQAEPGQRMLAAAGPPPAAAAGGAGSSASCRRLGPATSPALPRQPRANPPALSSALPTGEGTWQANDDVSLGVSRAENRTELRTWSGCEPSETGALCRRTAR